MTKQSKQASIANRYVHEFKRQRRNAEETVKTMLDRYLNYSSDGEFEGGNEVKQKDLYQDAFGSELNDLNSVGTHEVIDFDEYHPCHNP